MSEALPSVTVVIAARPGQEKILAVEASRRFDYPRELLEVIVARGTHPSVQRNRAVREARGELIYFLDDDSVAEPGSLRLAVGVFKDPRVQVVGGPNLCPDDAPPLEQAFAGAMANPLAFFSSSARYRATGETRDSSEKELILCNMMMRRDGFLSAGGFDEALYPNEENALMDDLQKSGGRLIYEPRLVVRRRPRHSLRAFNKMLINYGRGRAEQVRLHPGLGSLPNFVPPIFCVYLMSLLAALALGWPLYYYAPLAAYILLALLATLAIPKPPKASFLSVAGCIFLTHFFYGLGFWKGLFTSLKGPDDRPPVNVILERVQLA
ncbi:MAG TPA: glycosyltransferase [Verrucomicrobiae bacterium]|nr:glycosyltransferase [Verrucomicrobiae bacterium]